MIVNLFAEIHRVLTPVVEMYERIFIEPVKGVVVEAMESAIDKVEEPEDFNYLEKEI